MYQSNSVEDKTCRICGFVDTRNVNIFDTRWRNLLYKILTIFPITLYATDPLPKNICKKCVTNVTMIFDECQKLLKVQKKWIDNVRSNQPDHPYVYILDLIERSNKDVMHNIKNIAPDFQYRAFRPLFELHQSSSERSECDNNDRITNNDINRIFQYGATTINYVSSSNKVQDVKPKIIPTDLKKKISSADSGILATINNFSMDTTSSQDIQSQKNVKVLQLKEEKIREIKNKLQSNGCTLMSLASSASDTDGKTLHSFRCNYKCSICKRAFPNEKFLIKHMLTHVKVSARKIYEKKFLDRKIRRGRLIPMGDRKCIRCLNCWKVFVDNRGILDHWSKGECDFFCQICGKEYPSSPKMLREHVPAQHGISYKSSRRRILDRETSKMMHNYTPKGGMKNSIQNISNTNVIQIKTEPIDSDDQLNNLMETPTKVKRKVSSSTNVKCDICYLTFPNFQSKNSHMRKHKNEQQSMLYMNRMGQAGSSTQQHDTIPEIKTEPEENYEIFMDCNSDGNQLKQQGQHIGYTSRHDEYGNQKIQLKKLSDLQKPALLSQICENNPSSRPQTSTGEDKIVEKNKPMEDHMDYGKIYNCHPCGKKFASKTELFEHKRKCQLNNKFACRFCLRAFVTSADLQVHIMLMHRGS